jgi:hypothetical protein
MHPNVRDWLVEQLADDPRFLGAKHVILPRILLEMLERELHQLRRRLEKVDARERIREGLLGQAQDEAARRQRAAPAKRSRVARRDRKIRECLLAGIADPAEILKTIRESYEDLVCTGKGKRRKVIDAETMMKDYYQRHRKPS